MGELALPTTPRRAWSSLDDTRAGLRAGAAFGAVAAMVRLVYWMRPHPTEPFPSLEIALIQLAMPIAGGGIAGAAVGAFWPWRRHRITALALGFASASVFAASVTAGWLYPASWSVDATLPTLIAAAMLGSVLGSMLYDDSRPVTPEEVRQERARMGSSHRWTDKSVLTWEVCPCCGYRTYSARSCVLCEWEEDVEPSDLSLAEARNNFRQHASIYDPDHLPPWRSVPPSRKERDLRRRIMAVLDAMQHERRPTELHGLRQQVDTSLKALSAIQQGETERGSGARAGN